MQHENMSSATNTDRVTDQDIKNAVRATDEPFATAGDVAAAVGLSSEGARLRLLELVDAGEVLREKVGGSAVVYWLPEESR